MRKEIETARQQFPESIKRTPLEYNARLSAAYNCNVYLKREDQQIVRSYKIRGAYHKISSLTQEEKLRGVVCASAGNHAQGVAFSCNMLGIKGTIFMPRTTPLQKIDRTKTFGGDAIEIQLVGDTYDESSAAAKEHCEKHNAVFVHPFNDKKTIIGQGTVAYEIIQEMEQLNKKADAIIIPIGGGGLVAGCGTYLSEYEPTIEIFGVEPAGAAGMKASLEAGEVTRLQHVDTFVDGAAVQQVGDHAFSIARKFLKNIITAPENRICQTILEALREDGIILEPAGALAIDALHNLSSKYEGKNIICIVSGGNFDFSRLPEVQERALRYNGLKKYYVVQFAQRPGALREFLSVLGEDDDIIRFEYLKKSSKERGPALVGIISNKPENFIELHERLKQQNITYEDITDNEMYYDLLI